MKTKMQHRPSIVYLRKIQYKFKPVCKYAVTHMTQLLTLHRAMGICHVLWARCPATFQALCISCGPNHHQKTLFLMVI